MIIFRYLTREISAALSAVTGVLLLIFLSNQFVRYLSQAATGKFAGNMLLHLMLIEIPHLLAVLLPLGLFLGILLAYGRLYADNEMTVLSACGLSRLKLASLTLPITAIVAAIVAVLSLWLNPQLLTYRDELLSQTGTEMEIQTTLPGRFRELNHGKQIVYVENVSPNHFYLKNIFLAEQQPPDKNNPNVPNWMIATAESGYQTIDPKTGEHFFVTTNGKRYSGVAGNQNYEIMQFDNYGIRVDRQVADISGQQETFPTRQLLQFMHDHGKKAVLLTELEWRLSMPISAILLTFLAIPMSHVNPRQGRYSQLLPCILIYATYVNLLLVGRNWVMHGQIPLNLGLWWIHGLLLILIITLWINQTGWRNLWRKIFK